MARHGDKHVITGTGIVLWDGVNSPDTNDAGQQFWSLKLAFPANQPEVAELNALATEEFNTGMHKGKWPANGIWPLSDARPEEYEGAVAGHVILNAKTFRAVPDVYDANSKRLDPMIYRNMIYPGAKVQVILHAYSYNNKSKGISFGLDGIRIIDATGPRLAGAGGIDAGAAFGAVAPSAGAVAPPAGAPGMPPGVGVAPPSVAGTAAPGMPPVAPGTSPVAPGPAVAPPAGAPGTPPVAPNPGFLNPPAGAPGTPPVAPGAPGVAPPPSAPAAPVKTMTAAAGGNTYEAYIGSGWSDQQLIDAGLMVIQ